MTTLRRQLTIWDGVALSIGSIMGSGILFLPSLTYSVSGDDVLLAWCLTTLLCIPLLLVFREMTSIVQNERGLEGWIALGLGEKVAAAIPVLILATVGIGMPSAAIIAARYVEKLSYLTNDNSGCFALGLLWLAIISNLFGVKIGSSIQRFIALGLFAIGIALLIATFPKFNVPVRPLSPAWNLNSIFRGAVLAFWAYAGFENMTFIAGEFKKPARDIILSISIALLTCGILYLGLTLNLAATVPLENIDPLAGLYQLALHTPSVEITSRLVAGFAVVAVLVNLVSWTWGLSRMVFASAGKGNLPRYFGQLSRGGTPRRALFLLSVIFTILVETLRRAPQLMDACLTIVSTNFVFIYFLAILSYIFLSRNRAKKIFGIILLVPILLSMLSSGVLLLYPIIIVAMSLLIGFLRTVLFKDSSL